MVFPGNKFSSLKKLHHYRPALTKFETSENLPSICLNDDESPLPILNFIFQFNHRQSTPLWFPPSATEQPFFHSGNKLTKIFRVWSQHLKELLCNFQRSKNENWSVILDRIQRIFQVEKMPWWVQIWNLFHLGQGLWRVICRKVVDQALPIPWVNKTDTSYKDLRRASYSSRKFLIERSRSYF